MSGPRGSHFCWDGLQSPWHLVNKVTVRPVRNNLAKSIIVIVMNVIIAFLEAPANVTASLGESDAHFTCHFRGDSLFWRINGQLLNYVTYGEFRSRGIMATVIEVPANEHKETLSVRVSQQNNFTRVVCQRTVFGQISNFSNPAYLVIAGELSLPTT